MKVHADFSQAVSVDTEKIAWFPSPIPGVERKMLDRIGREVARATSLVRYAPGSSFSEHVHSGGEEFIVLEGVFQDEHSDYHAGSYVRNPIGTHHVPRSDDGCTIFVKLWQFDPRDSKQFSLDLGALDLQPSVDGVARIELHRFGPEVVTFEDWSANATIGIGDEGGVEILILDGAIAWAGKQLDRHDWLRLPPGEHASLECAGEGARLWIKRGHLGNITVPPQA